MFWFDAISNTLHYPLSLPHLVFFYSHPPEWRIWETSKSQNLKWALIKIFKKIKNKAEDLLIHHGVCHYGDLGALFSDGVKRCRRAGGSKSFSENVAFELSLVTSQSHKDKESSTPDGEASMSQWFMSMWCFQGTAGGFLHGEVVLEM